MTFRMLWFGSMLILASARIVVAQVTPALPAWLGEFAARVEGLSAQPQSDLRRWRAGREDIVTELLDAYRGEAEGRGWRESCELGSTWVTEINAHLRRLDRGFDRLALPLAESSVDVTPHVDVIVIETDFIEQLGERIRQNPGSAGFEIDRISIEIASHLIEMATAPCASGGATLSVNSYDDPGSSDVPHDGAGLDVVYLAVHLRALGAATRAEFGDLGPIGQSVYPLNPAMERRPEHLRPLSSIELDLLRPDWARGPGADHRNDGPFEDMSGNDLPTELGSAMDGGIRTSWPIYLNFHWAIEASLRLLVQRLETDHSIRRASIAGSVAVNTLLSSHRGPVEHNLIARLCALPQPVQLDLTDFLHRDSISIQLNGCRLAGLSIRNAWVRGGISFDDAEIRGALQINALTLGGSLRMNRLNADRVAIHNFRHLNPTLYDEGQPLDFVRRPDDRSIGGFAMRVDRGVTLSEVATDTLFLGRLESSELRLSDLEVTNDVDLWGAKIGWVFVSEGVDIGGQLTAWYSTMDVVRIGYDMSALARIRIGRLNLPHSRFLIRVYIRQLITDRISLFGGQASSLEIYCTEVSESLNITDFQVSRAIWFGGITADVLAASGTTGNLFQIGSDAIEELTPTENEPSEGRPCHNHSGFNRINLGQSQFAQIRLAGTISEEVYVNQARLGALSFNDYRGRLGPDAVMNLRNAEIDLLALGPQTMRRSDDGRGPTLEIDGAQIRQIRHFDPDLDEWRNAFTRVTRHAENDENGLAELYLEQILPATGNAVGDPSMRPAYSGTVYRMLRDAALAAGYPALERRLAIVQNQHYTSYVRDMSLLTWLFYRLGGLVNSFGYDNGKGVLILGLIWLIGFVILISDTLLWWARNLLSRALTGSAPKWATRIAPSGICPRLRLSGLFLSIDRTVPSLALDNSFSDPRRAILAGHDPALRALRPRRQKDLGAYTGILVVSLYIQRLVAFVVIMIMIGGVFNLFQ